MEAQSEKSARITNGIESRIESDKTSTIDRLTSRECSSNRFRGVQINAYGSIVPVRPIIDFAAEQEGIAIEEMYHCTDAEEPHLGVFIAYLPEQTHPAFV